MREQNSNGKFRILKFQNFQKIPKTELRNLRALILIVDSGVNEDEIKLDELENSIPIILVLKGKADKNLVEKCHICLATENAKIGNLSSSEALKKKLINRIVAETSIETEAIEMAERISEKTAPLAVKALLKAVIEGEKLELEEGLRLEAELFSQLFSTEDAREGTKAFLEKRSPNFQGK
ncbi:MAG: hypothetical protein D6687_05275 [Acidobacteria bacterium]|jgi:hypothetical protein|nr:MAG: hypothetical protein D6687_05275 [Acidobacteriota bacterium]GIU82795.1 MAG: hypothetical protein KatS3mg006_1859 [Pyrinomonadaceae bacterium]